MSANVWEIKDLNCNYFEKYHIAKYGKNTFWMKIPHSWSCETICPLSTTLQTHFSEQLPYSQLTLNCLICFLPLCLLLLAYFRTKKKWRCSIVSGMYLQIWGRQSQILIWKQEYFWKWTTQWLRLAIWTRRQRLCLRFHAVVVATLATVRDRAKCWNLCISSEVVLCQEKIGSNDCFPSEAKETEYSTVNDERSPRQSSGSVARIFTALIGTWRVERWRHSFCVD